MESGGKAVAVLAHGLDHIYPKQNTKLASNILDLGGALVSEYPPGVKPERWAFVARDRLQSALSDIVVVIETGVKGGTQHTIKAALDQKKLLTCVSPVEPYLAHDKTQGTLELIKNGKAHPLNDLCDLINCIDQVKAINALNNVKDQNVQQRLF